MSADEYDPEVYELLAWLEVSPRCEWSDIPEHLSPWWAIVERDRLHDGRVALSTVPGLGDLGKIALLKHRKAKAESGVQPPSVGEDPSAYVPVKELWPQRPEFKRDSDVTKFLDKLPNEPAPTGIRYRRAGQRRFVHAGDWLRYFAEKDRKASEALDAEEVQKTLVGVAARQAHERERKQGK